MAVGFEYLLAYAVEAGAISSEQADALWQRLWRTLFKLALDQDKIQSTQDPAREVLLRLKSAAESHRIIVSDIGLKSYPTDERENFPPGAVKVGTLNSDDADIEWHCDPDELYSAILKLYREQNMNLPWDKTTLWERLAQAGYTKTNEGRYTYRTGDGNRRRVICIPATSFIRAEAESEESPGKAAVDASETVIPARSPLSS